LINNEGICTILLYTFHKKKEAIKARLIQDLGYSYNKQVLWSHLNKLAIKK